MASLGTPPQLDPSNTTTVTTRIIMQRFLLATLLLLCSVSGVGQNTADGRAAFASVEEHGDYSINLQTLDVIINTPIHSKSGAIPFSYSRGYNSECTLGKLYGGNINWNCSPQGGFKHDGLQFSAMPTKISEGYLCPDGITMTYDWSKWQIVTNDNSSSHPIYIYGKVDVAGCYSSTLSYTTIDGTGMLLSVTRTGSDPSPSTTMRYNVTVTKRNGDVLTSSGNTGLNNPISFPLQVADPFGNKITSNGSAYTDTLGTTAVTATNNNWAYTDTTGTTQNITATVSSVTQEMVACGYTLNQANVLTNSYNYPDGTSQAFTWESQYAGTYTGRVASITNRTGGVVSFSYGSMYCSTGNVSYPTSLTVTTPDGVYSYTMGTGPSKVTTVLDPGKNKTVYTFTGGNTTIFPAAPVLGEVQEYQNTGTVASPAYTLLTTDIYCYNTNLTNCPTTAVILPITEKDVFHTINSMSTSSKVQQLFDGAGNLTSTARYGFGASSFTTQTAITYGSWNGSTCVAVGSGISNLPCDERTVDNASHTLAESRSTYNSKGAILTHSVWSGSTWLSTTFTPNANGTVASSVSPAGLTTTLSYAATGSGGCNGLLQTSSSATIQTGDTLTSSATWNCDGPVVLSATDANGNGTSSLYNDPMSRLTASTDQSGLTTNIDYTATTVRVHNSFGSSVGDVTSTVDGLGRGVLTQKKQGPSASNYDTVSKAYAYNGTNWQVSTSTPCVKTVGVNCGSSFAVSSLDPLGRPLLSTDAAGSGTGTYTYTNNDAAVVHGPAPTGENAKAVHVEVDGVGRTMSACSILTSGGVSCGQGLSGSGVLNTYAYTYATGSSTVAVTRGVQTHTTVRDALGRITSTTTPEAGTTTSYYDLSAPDCSSGVNGTLSESKDNAGNHVCYYNDLAGRLQSSSSNGVCNVFAYDTASVSPANPVPTGVTLANTAGKVIEAFTNNCTGGAAVTDEWFSYDKNGRMTDMWQMTPHSGGYYHTTVAYFANGVVNTLSGIPGYATYTYGVDGEGRASVAAQGAVTLVNGVTFDASGRALVVTVGAAGDADTFTYDADERMATYTFAVNGKTDVGTLTWNANGTLQKLAIVDGFNAGGTQTCTFGYDDIARLLSDNCGSTIWSQTFSYDQYDNLKKTGNPGISWIPGYSSTNNQYTTIGATYDANGRMTYDSFNSYTWNTFGNMSSVRAGSMAAVCGTSGTCVTYDARGRAVEKNVAGVYSEILYSPVGKTAIMSGASTVTQAYIPLPGMSMTTSGSGGTVRWMEHRDWLGSSRLTEKLVDRTVQYDRAFAPYGEMYDNFGSTTALDFTGDKQDLFAGLNDTPNREQIPNQGRWISPDPAGVSFRTPTRTRVGYRKLASQV